MSTTTPSSSHPLDLKAGAASPALADAAAAELQRFNEDAAAARHLTAIRIRGQLAELDGESGAG